MRARVVAAGVLTMCAVAGCASQSMDTGSPPLATPSPGSGGNTATQADSSPAGAPSSASLAQTASTASASSEPPLTAAAQTGPPGDLQADAQGQLHSKAAAAAKALAEIALAQLPPGAILQSAPLPAQLTQLGVGGGESLFEIQDRWWTVPGQADAAASFVKAHPPTGFQSASWSGGGPAGSEQSFSFDPLPSTHAPWGLFTEDVVQIGDHVGLRVEVQVDWLPTRTTIENIPATTASATVSWHGPTMLPQGQTPAAPVRRTLTGAPLRELAATLNGLETTSPSVHSCPAPSGETVTISFAYEGRRVVFSTDFSGCGGIDVAADRIAQPMLALSDEFRSTLHKVLGVPAQ